MASGYRPLARKPCKMIVCMVSCRVTWWPTWKGWSPLNYNLVMLSFGIPTCGTIVHPIAVIKADSVWVSLEQTQTSQRVKGYLWVIKGGLRLTHPPEKLIVGDGERIPPSPFPSGYLISS